MKKSLEKKIEAFLNSRVKIAPKNERAEADPKDVQALEDILQELIEAKWEPSYDGWVPVEPLLVNRSTHDPLNYLPVPSDRDWEQKNFEEQLATASFNVKIAAEELDRIQRVHHSLITREKAREAGLYCDLHGRFLEKNQPCQDCAALFQSKNSSKS